MIGKDSGLYFLIGKLLFSIEASSLRGSKEGEVAFSGFVGFRSEHAKIISPYTKYLISFSYYFTI